MKRGTAIFNGLLRTLQPGEYERTSFRVFDGALGDRYEIEGPQSIERSTEE